MNCPTNNGVHLRTPLFVGQFIKAAQSVGVWVAPGGGCARGQVVVVVVVGAPEVIWEDKRCGGCVGESGGYVVVVVGAPEIIWRTNLSFVLSHDFFSSP